MAQRSKRGGAPHLEHEIERCRELEHWSKVEELAKKFKNREDSALSSAQFVTLGNFLTGEAKLEQYLQEHPPLRDKSSHKTSEAKTGLREAKSCLLSTIGEEAKQLGVHLDSFILLGKLHFAEGCYKESLEYYERANIDNLEEKQLPPRSLKIMAEAFAIKAMCLEKLPVTSSSKTKANDRETNIVRCYEVAGDLTLLFLQVADRSETVGQSTWSVASAGTTATGGSSSPVPSDPIDAMKTPKERMGTILEAALYQSAKLNIKAGRNAKAISRWRSMLMAEESDSTKEIRRNLCCQLAEALMYGCSDGKYTRPDPIDISNPTRRASTRFSSTASVGQSSNLTTESPWRPKRSNLSNVYIPKNRSEEIVLSLILSEYIAGKDAVLSQEPKFSPDRKRTYEAATVTYDLLTLALARFSHYKLLCDALERSMKFSYHQSHTWEQFSLALACEGKMYRSLLVFQELANQLEQKEIDVGIFLSMARTCYERLGLYNEGLELCQRALQSQAANYSKLYSARCNVFVGLGHSLVARNVENQTERMDVLNKAEHHYKAALSMDPLDHIAAYYMALHYAESRKPSEAMTYAKKALKLNSEHLQSLQLTILILSAQRNYMDALQLTEQALEEYPDNLSFVTLKVRLTEVVHGSEEALQCAKGMLQQWQAAVEKMQSEDQQMAEDSGKTGGGGQGLASTPTLTGLPGQMGASSEVAVGYGTVHSGMRVFDAMSDKDSISLHAHSMTASHIERTLSEVASSLSSHFPPKSGSMDPMYSLMRIWLICAELHLRNDNILEADICTQEARSLMPISYHLMFVRGLIHEEKYEYEEARQCYENSLSINPSHVMSLFQLGRVYYHLGYNRLAEQTLKIAVRIDPCSEETWAVLGQVTEALARDFMGQGQVPPTYAAASTLSRSGSHSDGGSDSDTNDAMSNSASLMNMSADGDSGNPDVRYLKEESEFTPTEEIMAGFNCEATKLYSVAGECHSIALSLQYSSPIVPYSSIPLAFD